MLVGLAIQNFLSFGMEEQLILDLKQINIFIGKNNCGKSNILKYIKHMSSSDISTPINKEHRHKRHDNIETIPSLIEKEQSIRLKLVTETENITITYFVRTIIDCIINRLYQKINTDYIRINTAHIKTQEHIIEKLHEETNQNASRRSILMSPNKIINEVQDQIQFGNSPTTFHQSITLENIINCSWCG